jgi:hypothetical protein
MEMKLMSTVANKLRHYVVNKIISLAIINFNLKNFSQTAKVHLTAVKFSNASSYRQSINMLEK